jgi:hypothetical protein
MKKAFLTTGGAPILNDYINIAQDGLIEALSNVVSSFGANIFLHGADVSIAGTTHSITAGWGFWNGELLRIPAHSWEATVVGALGGLPNTIAYTEVIEVANPIPYADGLSHPISKETVLKFKEITTETVFTHILDFKKLGNCIAELVSPNFIKSFASYAGGYTLAGGILWTYDDGSAMAAGDRIKFSKLIDGRLIIDGLITSNGSSSTINGVADCELLLTLDADFRPEKAMHIANYTGNVGGGFHNIPSFGSAFVLFPDGKFCVRHSSGVTFRETHSIAKQQIVL